MRADRPKRTFVADDDEETRELAVRAFADDGHDVFGLDGEAELNECLEMVASHSLRRPDLIAMGVRMAWHSGIDLLDGLRCAGWTTPVVLMTWSVPANARVQLAQDGAVAIVRKPFNVTELRRAARRALTRDCDWLRKSERM